MAQLKQTDKSWEAFDRLTGEAKKVVLAGDSVLDNFVWLKDPRRNLRMVVEQELTGAICLNLAVDQMTTFDFKSRSAQQNGWMQYQHERRRVYGRKDDKCDYDGYEHLRGTDGVIRSVDNIARLKNVTHVILSIGGNDVYLNAGIQTTLFRSLLPFCDGRHRVARAFGERLRGIVDDLAAAVPGAQIIPVICYHPHHDFPISGIRGGCLGSVAGSVQRNYLSWMVTPMLSEVLAIAQERSMTVIDLSQTFDPFNDRHYGNMDKTAPAWSGAEPSDCSQEFIAKLIAEAVESPSDSPRILHGTTAGDVFCSCVETPLTDKVRATYRFHHGPKNPQVNVLSGNGGREGAGSTEDENAKKKKRKKDKKGGN